MDEQEILSTLEACGAILNGHFKLSSGLHSSMYVQCAKLLMHADTSSKICKALADKITKHGDFKGIDLVLSPAMGGLLVGYELSRHLNVPNIFCERVNGSFELRRGFEVPKGARILIVEDVVTTGKSTMEAHDLATSLGGEVVMVASIINRKNDDKIAHLPLVSLLNLTIPTYQPDKLPDGLQDIPAIKPGSRVFA